MDCSMPGLPVHHQLPELAETHIHWVSDPSNHLILCCPLLLPPSIFPCIRENESVLRMRWPKFRSFSISISPSNEYSGLISFRIDWLDLLTVQGTLKSLLQHHRSEASILWHSAWHSARWDGGRQIVVIPFYTWGKKTLMKFKLICPGPGTNKWLSRNSLTDIFTPNFYIPYSL